MKKEGYRLGDKEYPAIGFDDTLSDQEMQDLTEDIEEVEARKRMLKEYIKNNGRNKDENRDKEPGRKTGLREEP